MIDKIQNFILTPIKVSYKERSDYSPIENFILNPLVLALLVFLVTFQAFSLSGEAKPTQSDTALSNAMIYFEKGDFDNAVLQLESVVDNYSGQRLELGWAVVLSQAVRRAWSSGGFSGSIRAQCSAPRLGRALDVPEYEFRA